MITQKELREIRRLKTEIKLDRARLSELKRMSLTPVFTNERVSSGISDPTAAYAERLATLEQMVSQKLNELLSLLIKLQQYINTIDESEQRTVFYLKYVKLYSWQRIALELGEYDEQLPRKRHHRYLRKQGIK